MSSTDAEGQTGRDDVEDEPDFDDKYLSDMGQFNVGGALSWAKLFSSLLPPVFSSSNQVPAAAVPSPDSPALDQVAPSNIKEPSDAPPLPSMGVVSSKKSSLPASEQVLVPAPEDAKTPVVVDAVKNAASHLYEVIFGSNKQKS